MARGVHPAALLKRSKGVKLFLLLVGLAALLDMSPTPILPMALAQENRTDPLASYRDKKRVLLLFAPTEQDAAYQTQRRLWKGEEAGFKERQLVVLPLFANGYSPSAAPLANRFNVDPQTFAIVLIGKDGHNAFQGKEPVPVDALYRRIDAMPMRREEMQRQKEKP